MPRPKLIVISAPSGAGKTTIAKEILRRHPDIRFSVSATTRPKREHEVEGKDYIFLREDEFEDKIRKNELVEWEAIYGYSYGSLKRETDNALRDGISLLFDVDVNGALSIKRKYPTDTVLLFIKPPSIEILKERLTKRGTENEEILHRRLDRVPMEMEKAGAFDFCVTNDDLESTIRQVDEIVTNALELTP